MDDFEALMNQVGQDFDNATANDFGEDPPDGPYIVAISKVGIKRSQKGQGRWQVSWDFQIVWDPKGLHTNRHMFQHDGITKFANGEHTPNTVGMGILKNRLRVMGFDDVKSTNFREILPNTIGRVVALVQKENKGFTNHTFKTMVARTLDEFTAPATVSEGMQYFQDVGGSATKAVVNPTQVGKAAPAAPVNLPQLDFE